MASALPLPQFPTQAPDRWIERGLLLLWSVILFAGCYSLDTRHNRFPFTYHPDEAGKAEQVITGKFNYHHPMLLLAATRLAADLAHTPKTPQAVVEAGRRVSAAFIAGGTICLSLLAFLWRGWRPAMVTGVALTLHHQLYELGHYMKEDSALLFGIAFSMLAMIAYTQAPSAWRAAVLGGACALAISGKYLGVVILGIALPVLWVYSGRMAVEGFASSAQRRQRSRHAVAFLLALLVVFASINLSLLLHLRASQESLDREIGLVVEGQKDLTRKIPHALYWNVFIDNTSPMIWLLLVAFYTATFQRWRRLSLAHVLIIGFPVAYALMLSFSPKENDRYFLPATALFTTLAVLGLEAAPLLLSSFGKAIGNRDVDRLLHPERRWWVYSFLAAGLLLLQYTGWSSTKPGWKQYDIAFQHDDVAALIEWVKTEIPPDAIIAADSRAGLPKPPKKKKKRPDYVPLLPQKLLISKLASDEGTLEELRAKGVTYVVISETSYGRFFRQDLRAKDQESPKFANDRLFYEELLRNGVPLFQRDRGTVIYLHPGARVYRIQ